MGTSLGYILLRLFFLLFLSSLFLLLSSLSFLYSLGFLLSERTSGVLPVMFSLNMWVLNLYSCSKFQIQKFGS